MAYNRFQIIQKSSSWMTETMVIVDKETGVNYLYVHRGYGGGLTPLLDADGKPVITEVGAPVTTKDGYQK